MGRVVAAVGFVVGLALLTPAAWAQTGGVRGKVIDEEGQPLAEATVLIEYQRVSRRYEVNTDKKGEYLRIGLGPGPYRITAAREGYQARYVEIDVHLGDATDVPDIQLLSLETVARQMGRGEDQLREKFARAVERTRAGQLDEAEALFLELLAIQSDIPEIHQNLGYVYLQKKDWPRAESSYVAALELRPGDPDLTVALAQVYQDAGKGEKAMELLNRAVRENPQDATTQFKRGVFLVTSGELSEAVEAFEAVLAVDPSQAEAHYYLGTLRVNQGQLPEAVAHLETYLAANPKNAQHVETARGLLTALKK